MRKRLLLCAAVVAFATSAFASVPLAVPGSDHYALVGDVFDPTSARVTGMGGAGLGMTGYSDAFLFNPAALAESQFRLSIPTISVTIFNPRNIKDTDFFDNLKHGEWVGVADSLMSTLSYGLNEVERIDFGINAQFGHVGVALNNRERIIANLDTGSYLDGEYIVEDITALTVGFGYRIPLWSEAFSLDLGANAQFIYQLYSNAIERDQVITFIDHPDDATFSLASGWALPFTFGMNFNLPFGFRVGGAVRNVNGKFRYHFFDNVKDFDYLTAIETDDEYTYDAGVRYDAGVTWTSPFEGLNKWCKPTLSVDVLDVEDIKEDEDLYRNLYAGAQVTLFNFLDVRCGLAQGYQSIGIGLDAYIFHIDASYWRKDFGENFLDKSIDALTLRFQLITR